MTTDGYLKKYDPENFERSPYGNYFEYTGGLTEPDEYFYSQESLTWCCGVFEPECRNLAIIVVQDQMSEQQFVDFLLSGLTKTGAAGLVITDISRNKKKVHKYLSSVIKPVKLGINKSTRNTIYIWTISINDLKAKSKQYGKTVKAKKPATHKKTKAY